MERNEGGEVGGEEEDREASGEGQKKKREDSRGIEK